MFIFRRLKFLTCLVVLAIAIVGVSCGGKEEPPVNRVVRPSKSGHKKPAAPKPKPKPKPKSGPVTLEVLQLMPESAGYACAIPPLSNVYPKTVALAQRIAPSQADAKTMIEDIVAELARELKVDETLSLVDIAKAKGIDPTKPIGFFADFTPTQASVKAVSDTPVTGSEPKEGGEAGSVEKTGEESSEDKLVMEIERVDSTEFEAAMKQLGAVQKIAKKMVLPAMVGVIGCVDEVAIETTLKETLACERIGIDVSEVDDETVDGITYHSVVSSNFIYSIQNGYLVFGNSMDFLKAIAGRFKTPAKIRYGTPQCPAEANDDFVQLVRMDKLASIMEGVMPLLLALNPEMKDVAEKQMQSQLEMLAAFKGTDPMVSTFNFSGDKLEAVSKLDTVEHPEIAAMAGQPKPLHLAALLPKSTLAMLSIGLNEASKATIQKNLMGVDQGNPQEVMMDQLKTYMNMVGEEITLGITGFDGLFPKVVALLDLANAEEVKGMLSMTLQGMPAETYNNVELMKLSMPLPVSVSFGYVGNTLALATDLGQLKTIIDLFQSGNKSEFMPSLRPPIDPNAPLYSMFIARGELVTEFLKTPLMQAQLSTSVSSGPLIALRKVEQTIDEIRMTKNVNKDWQESRLTVKLK